MSVQVPQAESNAVLWKSALVAFAIEAIVLVGIGTSYRLGAPAARDENRFIEAEVVSFPKEAAKLASATLTATETPSPVHREKAISAVPNQGKTKASPVHDAPVSNEVAAAAPASATHGPIAIDSPAPVLPNYLKNQDLSTSVVIEFLISAAGAVEPRLLRTSGNEELDQIALTTARAWKFRPAEADHRAIDAKIRLRILFEVH